VGDDGTNIMLSGFDHSDLRELMHTIEQLLPELASLASQMKDDTTLSAVQHANSANRKGGNDGTSPANPKRKRAEITADLAEPLSDPDTASAASSELHSAMLTRMRPLCRALLQV